MQNSRAYKVRTNLLSTRPSHRFAKHPQSGTRHLIRFDKGRVRGRGQAGLVPFCSRQRDWSACPAAPCTERRGGGRGRDEGAGMHAAGRGNVPCRPLPPSTEYLASAVASGVHLCGANNRRCLRRLVRVLVLVSPTPTSTSTFLR